MQTTNIILYILCYVAFFAFGWLCKINGCHRLINDDGVFTSKPVKLIGAHLFGMFLLVLIPVILQNHSALKVLMANKTPDAFLILLYVLIFTLVLIIAFKQSKYNYEKGTRLSENFTHLSSNFFIYYFITRALFLFAYELWFRGFLLFDCISWIGVPLAVFVNLSLYVLVHIFNSRKEILACIPFGILVCFLSILFNAVWPAIILHIGFSLVYELSIYRFNLNNFKIAKS
jgi:hypothetical protein